MRIHKLSTTAAFVAIDLDAPAEAAGAVRLAPKILQGGAQDLARSLTYTYASLGIARAGASAGINATPEERDAAVAAFVEELTPLAVAGTLRLEAGKGVTADEVAALAPPAAPDPDRAAALSIVAAASGAVGDLDGTTVAIEGIGADHGALVAELAGRGARIVAVSSGAEAVLSPEGFAADALQAAMGTGALGELGAAEPAWKVFMAGADVLVAGSKVGAIAHGTAERLVTRAVVPHSPLAYTTKALVMLQRKGTVMVPDFLALAGPTLAAGGAGDGTIVDAVTARMTDAMTATDGCFLGACRAAEAFLLTWQSALPFGRPLAA